MNIDELGIKPLSYGIYDTDRYTSHIIFDLEAVRELEQQNAELREALILVLDERFTGLRKSETGQFAAIIIEKATGKTWQEIKQLIS